jgi:endonuclease/exonuclease/phosphatase family metal-dependent hydrolase
MITRLPSALRFLVASLALVTGGCVSYQLAPQSELLVNETQMQIVRAGGAPTLRLMSINLAHGRGDGFHQALQSGAQAQRNLDAISALLERERPHVVALQEADAESVWSGGFHHVDYLSREAGYGWGLHSAHAEGAGLSYGTGLISRLPIGEHRAMTFVPARATLPKGFSLATVRWPRTAMAVDVVSVHFEPLRGTVRQQQARQLVAALADRGRPLVIMGDFNTGWDNDDGVLRNLTAKLGLHAFSPEDATLVTYPRLGRRLDWILVSDDFEFAGFRVLDDAVSDHRAIVADLRPRAVEDRRQAHALESGI